jgi:gliding motility-associated-like protein
MRKITLTILSFVFAVVSFGQTPNDCSEGFDNNVCNEEPFTITSDTSTDDVVDFGAGTGSNPSTNPNGTNQGCLLGGETSSTFMLVNVISDGTLEWSIGDDAGSFNCFDWIMWPIQTDGSTCAQLQAGTLPPVSCNWNGNCEGFTGMADAANMPAGGEASNFEAAINVTAGEQYLICLSNFSFADLDVPISFFGSAAISCSASVPDQTICEGDIAEANVILEGLTNPGFSWNTTVGVMGDPSAGPDFDLNPTVTTDYEIYITENGAPTDTARFTITVVYPPTPDAGLDDDACAQINYQLTGTPSDPANITSWSFVGPSGTATANFIPNNIVLNPNVNANQAGVYQYVFSEDNGVCPVETDIVEIEHHLVTQDIVTVDPLCGNQCSGSITITSPTAVSYSIDNGLNWAANNDFQGLCAGDYVVISKDAFGCVTSDPITLTDPAPVTITVSADITICIDGSTELLADASVGTSFDYTWSHTASTDSNQVVMPVSDTQYDVFATNEFGCTSPIVSINVSLFPPLTVTITPDNTVCPGDSSTITVNVSGGMGAPYYYNWFEPVNAHPSGTNEATFTPLASTTYRIEVTDGCSTPMKVVQSSIIVDPVPVPDFVSDITESCAPGEFNLSNLTDPALSDQLVWNISSGSSLNNLQNINLNIDEPGSYDVQLIVTSSAGCTDSITKSDYLKVYAIPIAEFTNTPKYPTMFNPTTTMVNLSVGAVSYEWDFGTDGNPMLSTEENPTVTYPDATVATYPSQLIVTSIHGCLDTAWLDIDVIPELLLYVPNSFTPDEDVFNPTWGVVIDGIDVVGFELNVFNRWGELVWKAQDPSEKWDGTYQGKLVETGTYVWTLSAKDVVNDKKYAFNGHLTVLY